MPDELPKPDISQQEAVANAAELAERSDVTEPEKNPSQASTTAATLEVADLKREYANERRYSEEREDRKDAAAERREAARRETIRLVVLPISLATITMIGLIATGYFSYKSVAVGRDNNEKIVEVKTAVDGRMTEMLELTKKIAEDKGFKEGRKDNP